MTTIRNIGPAQRDALWFYFLESIHAEAGDVPPFYLDGSTLTVPDRDIAFSRLMDAVNDADADGFADWREALARLASRVIRA